MPHIYCMVNSLREVSPRREFDRRVTYPRNSVGIRRGMISNLGNVYLSVGRIIQRETTHMCSVASVITTIGCVAVVVDYERLGISNCPFSRSKIRVALVYPGIENGNFNWGVLFMSP